MLELVEIGADSRNGFAKPEIGEVGELNEEVDFETTEGSKITAEIFFHPVDAGVDGFNGIGGVEVFACVFGKN